jgi:hypothetical protein
MFAIDENNILIIPEAASDESIATGCQFPILLLMRLAQVKQSFQTAGMAEAMEEDVFDEDD